MDVSAIPRPHSAQQRPTQQYYVPRRIIECGRGSNTKTETTTTASTKNKKDEKSASSSVQRSPKSNAPPTSNQKSNQQQKPRPLMEQILAPPPALRHHKEKSPSHNNNNNNNNTKKEVKFQTPVVVTKKSTSTASSRSSSSMSSSMSPTSTAAYSIPTTVPNGVTKSTPRVLRPQKYAKNLFAPTVATVSTQCNCDRGNTHIMCRRCGYECVGRVLQTCGVHPLIIALNDLRECPNSVCRSTQIVELDTAELDDQLIAQLAEPIHKIDLLADD